jgi:hypothetical protein
MKDSTPPEGRGIEFGLKERTAQAKDRAHKRWVFLIMLYQQQRRLGLCMIGKVKSTKASATRERVFERVNPLPAALQVYQHSFDGGARDLSRGAAQMKRDARCQGSLTEGFTTASYCTGTAACRRCMI